MHYSSTLDRSSGLIREAQRLQSALIAAGASPEKAGLVVVDLGGLNLARARGWRLGRKRLVDQVEIPPEWHAVDSSAFCALDWQSASPDVLGTLHENCKSGGDRKETGAYYTPPEVVAYLVRSVVGGILKDEIGVSWSTLSADQIESEDRTSLLIAAHSRLATISALDPACGCGAFLRGMLRELVLLERVIIARLHTLGVNLVAGVSPYQVHGVDIDPIAVEVARHVLVFTSQELGCRMHKEPHVRVGAVRILTPSG